jgi:signal peptidase I
LKYKIEKTKVTFPNQEEMFSRYGLENDPSGARMDFETRDQTYYFLNLTKSEKSKIEKDFKVKLEIDVTLQYSKSKDYKPNVGELIDNIRTFPKDFYVNNNVTNFEEFQVPFKGKVVDFRKENIAYYRRIITAYESHKLEEKKDGIYIDGKKTNTYKIQMNYYWLMGDNRYNSADSRIWGFVPEDHVVGRASLVWFSKSAYMGIRWERLFKLIK